MLSKILILSIVVGVCIAATVTIPAKPEAKLPPVATALAAEDLKTAERSAKQFGGGFGFGVPSFGFGGYGGYGHYPGGFGGYGGYGGAWGGHHNGGGYGGYGHGSYPHGGGYGHHHHG